MSNKDSDRFEMAPAGLDLKCYGDVAHRCLHSAAQITGGHTLNINQTYPIASVFVSGKSKPINFVFYGALGAASLSWTLSRTSSFSSCR